MKENDNLLKEIREEIRDLYSPGNDRVSKIQLAVAMAMINMMIKVQAAAEKVGAKTVVHLTKHIKTKRR